MTKKTKMTSHCYLGDAIDHFKRDFINDIPLKKKVILKKVARVKNQKSYIDHFKKFFDDVTPGFYFPKQEFSYVNKSAEYIFFDPPTGLRIKDPVDLCFGSKRSGSYYIHIDKLRKIVENVNHKELKAFSVYQHFSHSEKDDYRSHLKKLLVELDPEKKFKYAYLLQFKDFFIITLSKTSKVKEAFSFQMKLAKESKSPRLKDRFVEIIRK